MRGRGLMLVAGMRAGERRAEAAQAQQQAQQEAQAQAYQKGQQAMVGAGAGGQDVTAELQKLAELHKSGVLTAQEFDAAKKKLLA